MEYKIGQKIKIIKLDDPINHTYPGRTGEILYIDSMGQLHGTWGGLAVIPGVDEFEILGE